MSNSIEQLSACISPLATARVFNPMRPEYYLKDLTVSAPPKTEAVNSAVRITLSAEAQSAMRS